MYSAKGNILLAYPLKATATEYTIADGCLGVGEGAFAHTTLQKVIVPEGMRAFDDNAFSESSLAEINFPESLVLFGNQAFAKTQLTTVVLPENMTNVYEGTFAQSTKLQSLTIPSGIRTIESYAFNGCTALTEIHCLGAEPATLNYYEGYDHPFNGIDASQVKVYVPKGFKSAYESSEWGYQFDNIIESNTGIFLQESTNPANDAEMESIGTIEITFPENASLVEQFPSVKVVKGQELYGEPVENAGGWMAFASGKKVNVFPADEYQEGPQPIPMEDGVDYYVTIPAGIVKNAEGSLNQKIVLHFVGKIESGVDRIESNDCFVTNNNGTLNVVLGNLTDCTVVLFNATGNLINSISHAQGTATLHVESNGLYIIRIVSGDTIKTFKIVK